jgi:hypothetical protein
LIDTAGRLHTRFNLMEELKKVYRWLVSLTRGSSGSVVGYGCDYRTECLAAGARF